MPVVPVVPGPGSILTTLIGLVLATAPPPATILLNITNKEHSNLILDKGEEM